MSNLNNQPNSNKTGFKVAIAALALFLLAALGGVYHFSNESDTHANKAVQLKSELTELNDEKLGLEAEVSQLTATYDAETVKNTELEAKIVDAEQKIKGLKVGFIKSKKSCLKLKSATKKCNNESLN